MAQLFCSSLTWWNTGCNAGKSAGDLLNLCKGIIAKSIEHLSTKGASEGYFLMNRHQCGFLVKKLTETQNSLTYIQQSSLDEKTIPVLQQLHQTLLDAERLIDSSCTTTSEWLRAAIEQNDTKESFSKLLYDVKWHVDVLQSILVDDFEGSRISFEPGLCNGKLTLGEELSLLTAKKEDDKVLQDRLRSVQLDDPTERDLADQLLASTSSKLFFLNPQNLNDYYSGTLLGRGSFAEVRLTNLLGGEYAIKIFEQQKTYSFDQEVAALQGLGHHPHIVHLLCYSKSNSKCFLIMEKMDMELSAFLQRKKEFGRVLSDVEAVVLMLEIAEGIRYIHSKRMAHRDLKPGNVLVNVEGDPSSNLFRICSVKIADFGLTKIKNASRTNADQTFNVGTSRYMAPEVMRGEDDPERAELNSTKADVFSFAIMCSEILTGENAFENLPKKEMKRQVKAGEGPLSRPELPRECPQRLITLIQRCWDGNFRKRPDFNSICEELRYIKGLILRGDRQTSETEDVVEFGFNVQGGQELEMTSSQATPKRWFSSFVSKFVPTRLCDVRRVNWTSKMPCFPIVLIFLLLLLLSIGVASYHAMQHQLSWEPSIGVKAGDQFSIVAAPTKEIKQGPWGRDEPKKVTGFFDHKANSIKSILLKYDQNPPGVGVMEVVYANPDRVEFKRRYGENIVGLKVVKIEFESDEYIKQVSGSMDKYYVSAGREKIGLISVVSLTIHTNLRSYGPYGDEVGHRFRSGTGKVVGFFGAAGVLLDKLGVWIIPDGQDDGDESFLIEQN